MYIEIDYREKELIKQLSQLITFTPEFKKIKHVVKNLLIGDIIIKDDFENEILIIERKIISDLLSSIKDGRYEEQSYRLNGSNVNNHNIVYLIEGDMTCKKTKSLLEKSSFSKNIFYSSMLSLSYYKGFSVTRTFDINETAYYICNTINKIQKSNNSLFIKILLIAIQTSIQMSIQMSIQT